MKNVLSEVSNRGKQTAGCIVDSKDVQKGVRRPLQNDHQQGQQLSTLIAGDTYPKRCLSKICKAADLRHWPI